MSFLRKLADNSNVHSLANKLRRKRFAFFCELLKDQPRPISILDVGGTPLFWQQMESTKLGEFSLTLLNNNPEELDTTLLSGGKHIFAVIGDARSMPQFADKQFNVVFSNSVLEHFAQEKDQRRIIAEMLRVGQMFFIQTPNYYFPVEPHFHFPGFQFLPLELRAWLLSSFSLGWTPRISGRAQAREVARCVRLLTEKKLRELCPAGHIYHEKFCGLTKSFILYGP